MQEVDINPKQRCVLIAAALSMVITFLLPPVYWDNHVSYRWLFDPWHGRIDVPMLLLEWAVVATLTGVGWLLSRGRPIQKG
jgi:hypothetical protein